jgi:hypothetical protein
LAHLAARSEQAGDQVAVYDGVSEGPLEAVLRELTSHHGIVADTTPSSRHVCRPVYSAVYGSWLRIITGRLTREPIVRRSVSFQPFHGIVTHRLAGMNGVVAGL